MQAGCFPEVRGTVGARAGERAGLEVTVTWGPFAEGQAPVVMYGCECWTIKKAEQ